MWYTLAAMGAPDSRNSPFVIWVLLNATPGFVLAFIAMSS